MVLTISIRQATSADEPAMSRVFRSAAVEAWQHFMPRSKLETIQAAPERILALLDTPKSRALVAVVDGHVQGFAVVRHSPDADAEPTTGELDLFYVAPDFQGLGVGRRLMGAVFETLKEFGYESATLWTGALNHRPRRIYEAAGWRTDGMTRHRVVLETPIDEVRYRVEVSKL